LRIQDLMTLDSFPPALTSLVLIGMAELGDKSQLVCMALAARHRAAPVLLGACVAFLILNALAVVLGAGLAVWLPDRVMAGLVALAFAGFGIHALTAGPDDDPEEHRERRARGIFLTTLSLIFLAELGDKTQIAVAALGATLDPLQVWLGATLALFGLSALGVWIGRSYLKRLPTVWLHRLSGLVFLAVGSLAALRALT
jgi:putative Ca2+/H+ antiporter (TMEM165/GDT1 family)